MTSPSTSPTLSAKYNGAANGHGPVAELRRISKTYFKPDGSVLVEALRGIDLCIQPGQYIAIMGASGSGKSTLMNILGCLDRPTSGAYLLDNGNVAQMDDDSLSRVRGRKIGFVFQAFNLISELNIVENVEVPLFYQGIPKAVRRERAIEKLQAVGLGDRLTHRPRELSGGQQQRVAIARALVTDPSIIMADEPTGNLDSKTGQTILQLISLLHQAGMTIIVVTHDQRIADRCQRIIRLRDGELESDSLQSQDNHSGYAPGDES
ncbi:MAG: ABC transporter ATP-binding protein [Phycisphaerales bacterium]|nr:ABC transporter ATP-binding protein [Phycisphaerales bacterium]MCI0677168.1 ABC transporter ATP-binding protein [Phycisphaerales bacterium]